MRKTNLKTFRTFTIYLFSFAYEIMLNPFKSYRTLSRTRHILLIVSKHGFGELMGWLKVRAWWRRTTPTGRPPALSRAKRFRLMLEELGPTFIKFGQLLSTRSDLLPADVVEELVYLQDRVTTLPWKSMKSRFEQAGINIAQTFSSFDTNSHRKRIAGAGLCCHPYNRRKSRRKSIAAEYRRYHQC